MNVVISSLKRPRNSRVLASDLRARQVLLERPAEGRLCFAAVNGYRLAAWLEREQRKPRRRIFWTEESAGLCGFARTRATERLGPISFVSRRRGGLCAQALSPRNGRSKPRHSGRKRRKWLRVPRKTQPRSAHCTFRLRACRSQARRPCPEWSCHAAS